MSGQPVELRRRHVDIDGPHARVPIQEESDVVMARKSAREVAREAGLSESATAALATATTEVARNIVVHAAAGEIRVGLVEAHGRRGVIVIAVDEGPGIQDPVQALQDGFSTAESLGLGLPGAQRLMDEFELISVVGEGTAVIMRKWAR